jgi:hypothetical protein
MHVDAPASLPVGSPAPHRFRTAALALTALWAIVILAHLGVVSGLETFAYEDFLSWFAPTRMVVDAAWAGGRVPAWDPFVGVGGPLVFNSAAAPLYPLNALAAGPLGGGMTGLHRLIVLHLALGGTFTYLLLAERGCRPFVALAGGLSFAFAGPLLSYAQENPYHVFGLTWVPLGLMAFLRFLETGRRWPVALAGVCMALMLYGGEPQVWYFFVCLLTAAGLGHALGEATPPGRRTRALGRIALALTAVVVLALLLSAAQSAATLAGLRDSARGRGEPLDVRLAFSVHPLRYLSLLLPDFTGTPFPENTLWANGLTQHYRTWVMSFFVGSWTLLCLPYALCRGPGRGTVGGARRRPVVLSGDGARPVRTGVSARRRGAARSADVPVSGEVGGAGPAAADHARRRRPRTPAARPATRPGHRARRSSARRGDGRDRPAPARCHRRDGPLSRPGPGGRRGDGHCRCGSASGGRRARPRQRPRVSVPARRRGPPRRAVRRRRSRARVRQRGRARQSTP